jgi:hypothetical protein
MGYRHPNPRLAKIHRNYSVEDVSRLFAIHKNTVRNWMRDGLEPIDDQRPALVKGQELARFLIDRRARSKQTCGPGRIYCLPCRAPKVPAGKIADCVLISDTTATVHGICPDCNRIIYRRVNPQKLEAMRGELDIKITQPRTRIEETAKPNVNCDSSGGDHR